MQSNVQTKSRRTTGGTVLITLGGIMLIGSAGAKFARIPKVTAQLGAYGFDGDKLMFIAALEVVCAVLFLVPRTRSFGLLMVSSFMGGAIATHMQHSESIIQPAFVLALLWLGAWLRHPELLRNLNSFTPTGTPLEQQRRRERALGRI